MSDILALASRATASGKLLDSSFKNLQSLLESNPDAFVRDSISELVLDEAWEELNDRFFRTLAFGTGGLRGRTIGRRVTKAESGTPDPLGDPSTPASARTR